MRKILIATAALLMGGASAFAGYKAETCLGTIASVKKISRDPGASIPKAQVITLLDDIATVCGMELASLRDSPARHKRNY